AGGKSPAGRDATGLELAADLRRFLEDRPIQARRPTAWQRLTRWARRHRAVVLSALAAVFAVLVVTVTALALSYRQIEEKRAQTEQEKQKAEEEKRKADDALGKETQARDDLARALGALQAEQQRTRRALERERQTLYFHRVDRAYREWLADDATRAARLLADCPPGLRQWEWDYVRRLCHSDWLTLRGHTHSVNAVAHRPHRTQPASPGARRPRPPRDRQPS